MYIKMQVHIWTMKRLRHRQENKKENKNFCQHF